MRRRRAHANQVGGRPRVGPGETEPIDEAHSLTERRQIVPRARSTRNLDREAGRRTATFDTPAARTKRNDQEKVEWRGVAGRALCVLPAHDLRLDTHLGVHVSVRICYFPHTSTHLLVH